MTAPSALPQDVSADFDALAARLRALAHPVRLKVLATLAERDRCVCGEIVAGLPLAQSTVSQHIKILLEAGLVRSAPAGQRSCYCADRDAIARLRAELDVLFARLLPSCSSLDGADLSAEAATSPDRP
ncbi:winged helix-turn-helix transcriptional regulator [Aquabacter sp. L1I39]|uniref:ArsR/SmtB family transcription factor n=1 Tax=Aquabacter sp. L1I39 TaxID=2820278 RepID=UPI001ADD1906|nr:metalloregulator ArsR/SmtB family transcription factor [Aquabacter sp. L1I39]QTL01596.1 winged helix-turn-helix transcriptional regulator [Aquabacter sp. L1I39]